MLPTLVPMLRNGPKPHACAPSCATSARSLQTNVPWNLELFNSSNEVGQGRSANSNDSAEAVFWDILIRFKCYPTENCQVSFFIFLSLVLGRLHERRGVLRFERRLASKQFFLYAVSKHRALHNPIHSALDFVPTRDTV